MSRSVIVMIERRWTGTVVEHWYIGKDSLVEGEVSCRCIFELLVTKTVCFVEELSVLNLR